MNKPHHNEHAPTHPKAPPKPFVEVTIVFRDVLNHPIEGLAVRVAAGTGSPPAPAWMTGPDTAPPIVLSPPASEPPAPSATVVNSTDAVTDKDGYALTIQNAARDQPIDVLVRNRQGAYVWKATMIAKKDFSAFTVVSPEYHLEATTKLTPKEEFEQDLNLPVVKHGEIMTIERLVSEFGAYIGWSQIVTEQGRVKRDVPTRKKEIIEDEKTHKTKAHVTIEHHYKVVDDGKPRTTVLNVLGSRLNYPFPDTFSNQEYQWMATQLNVAVAAIKAIVMQECGGTPFEANGLPKIRYERHRFYNLLKLRHERREAEAAKENHEKGTNKKANPFNNPYLQYPDLCFPKLGGYGPDGLHQYQKLIRAAALDFDLSIQACSWGGFQILASEYAACGCATSFEFANQFMSGAHGQAKIFVSFMNNVKPHGVEALRSHNWEGVANAYNGAYWESANPDYAKNLKEFYEKFK